MTHLSLFSGIGGLDLAAEMAGLLFGGFLTALVSAQRQEEAYIDGYMKGARDAKEKKEKSYADWIFGRGEDGEA